MPIYEYLCDSCGAEKEHLQKISDMPINTCPVCGSSNYTKLISAAGFQLKGSGWYATDFKNKNIKQDDTKSVKKEDVESKPSSVPVASDSPAKTESNSTSSTTAD